MNVLVACEESQAVTIELRKLGVNAFSCDIIECSGGHPEWHIRGDVKNLFNGECLFTCADGTRHRAPDRWDMILAFPPCTYLTCTGNRWFNVSRYGHKALKRLSDRELAISFFMLFADATCEHIAIENPVGVMSTEFRKPDQIIQPYYFGDCEKKTTCLWLKGLPKLTPTKIVEPNIYKCKNGKREPMWHMKTMGLPKEERSKIRSKTYPGIAKAMAEQWVEYLRKECGLD